ncbi:MAG: choline kinase [Gammaproteobacteria bacterium]|jgi:choline kinase
MRAIILAAGVGRRLGEHGDNPKSLLEFGGRSLLDRHISNLKACNISDITLCVGYRRALIESAVRELGYDGVRTIVNGEYELGSIVSLWATRDVLRSGEDVILMDADVLYATEIIHALFKTPIENRFLFDRNFIPGDEPVKICLQDGRIVEFRKRIADKLTYNDCGESVGFFSLKSAMAIKLAEVTERYIAEDRRNEPYEEAIRDIALANPQEFAIEDVTGSAWIEIDFPEDIVRARKEILPKIDDK